MFLLLVPERVSKPLVYNIAAESVILEWDPPSDGGSQITGYTIYKQLNDEGLFTQHASVSLAAIAEKVTGLAPFTSYRFKVAGVNGRGQGNTSEASDLIMTAPSGRFPNYVTC